MFVPKSSFVVASLVCLVSMASPRIAEAEDEAPAVSVAPAPPTAPEHGSEPKFSVMAGLMQWVLRGGNLALEYKVGHFAFEVSHGQGIDLNQLGGFALTSDERDAGAHVRIPWTTGFGIGYRITENLHLLVEFKAHRYEVSSRDPASQVAYTTFSVGPGAFYSIYLYKGLFLEPNVRFWPTIGSTLSNNQAVLRQPDGSIYEHRAHDLGLFANCNLGYTF
jgi:hypothetical protein